MRPPGECRTALRLVAQQLDQGATWRDLAAQSGVGWDVARHTVENMHRSGELVVVGQVRGAGSARPMNLYVPGHVQHASNDEPPMAVQPQPQDDCGIELQILCVSWMQDR